MDSTIKIVRQLIGCQNKLSHTKKPYKNVKVPKKWGLKVVTENI
jgi:hypothetical protein